VISSPTIEASSLHKVAREDALAFVDSKLGEASSWPSPLIQYRLSADFQSVWKEELGHWLKTAERLGFLDRVLHEIEHQAKKRSKKDTGEVRANDERHLKLHQHLAAARLAYYLTGTGWEFKAYEPESGGAIDIDLSLAAPGEQAVDFQVKAPDQPGERAAGRVVDGEHDKRIIEAIDHAVKQLRRPPSGPALIGISANRTWPFAWDPTAAVVHLVGSTHGYDDGSTSLEPENRGLFFSDGWKHASGVMFLDFAVGRGFDDLEDRVLYPCTVLLNPLAICRASAAWFPHARVSYLDGQIFRWANGAPQNGNTLPEGTMLLPQRAS
jgi:hypothetical protein